MLHTGIYAALEGKTTSDTERFSEEHLGLASGITIVVLVQLQEHLGFRH